MPDKPHVRLHKVCCKLKKTHHTLGPLIMLRSPTEKILSRKDSTQTYTYACQLNVRWAPPTKTDAPSEYSLTRGSSYGLRGKCHAFKLTCRSQLVGLTGCGEKGIHIPSFLTSTSTSFPSRKTRPCMCDPICLQ